jgi:RimJ/RimL family protein N-acetyltransferase
MTSAIVLLIARAIADPRVTCLIAETAVDNLPSQAVLARAGFTRGAERSDAADGLVVRWTLPAVESA